MTSLKLVGKGMFRWVYPDFLRVFGKGCIEDGLNWCRRHRRDNSPVYSLRSAISLASRNYLSIESNINTSKLNARRKSLLSFIVKPVLIGSLYFDLVCCSRQSFWCRIGRATLVLMVCIAAWISLVWLESFPFTIIYLTKNKSNGRTISSLRHQPVHSASKVWSRRSRQLVGMELRTDPVGIYDLITCTHCCEKPPTSEMVSSLDMITRRFSSMHPSVFRVQTHTLSHKWSLLCHLKNNRRGIYQLNNYDMVGKTHRDHKLNNNLSTYPITAGRSG